MAPPPAARTLSSGSNIIASPTSRAPANVAVSSMEYGSSGTMLPPPKPTKSSSLPPTYPRSSAKRALPGTKKPRSKRIKQTDNRSTVTTTTDTAKKHVNVYDAVLGEAEDLLHAAFQAQALGRLKMASAYQLLLHARLVGLGKRVDRATTVVVEDPPPPSPRLHPLDHGSSSADETSTTTVATPTVTTSAPGTPASVATAAAVGGLRRR